MKILAIRKCSNCGNDIEIFHRKRLEVENVFCSRKCQGAYIKKNLENNAICPICNKGFHCKPYNLNRYKNVCCSRECSLELRRINMSGENNHQYGLKGNKNSSWKSDERISHYGYRLIRVLDHPFRNGDDMVFEHRLVAEKHLLNEQNSVEIDGKRYLSRKYDVHHINENRLDNRVENLMVLTKSEHKRLHNLKNPRKRDELGRFMKGA